MLFRSYFVREIVVVKKDGWQMIKRLVPKEVTKNLLAIMLLTLSIF